MRRPTTSYSTVINRSRSERERRSLHSHFTETIGGVEWIVFGTEPAAAIVVPRGLKNESCHEWISGGIMPSHFRFHSMVEFIEPPTWSGLPARSNLRSRKSRAISTNANSTVIFVPTNHSGILPSNALLLFPFYSLPRAVTYSEKYVKMCILEIIRVLPVNARSIVNLFLAVTLRVCRERKRCEQGSRVAEIRDSLKRIMRPYTQQHTTTHAPRIHVSLGMLNTRYRGSNLFDPRYLPIARRYLSNIRLP